MFIAFGCGAVGCCFEPSDWKKNLSTQHWIGTLLGNLKGNKMIELCPAFHMLLPKTRCVLLTPTAPMAARLWDVCTLPYQSSFRTSVACCVDAGIFRINTVVFDDMCYKEHYKHLVRCRNISGKYGSYRRHALLGELLQKHLVRCQDILSKYGSSWRHVLQGILQGSSRVSGYFG